MSCKKISSSSYILVFWLDLGQAVEVKVSRAKFSVCSLLHW